MIVKKYTRYEKLCRRLRYAWYSVKKSHLNFINKAKVDYDIECFDPIRHDLAYENKQNIRREGNPSKLIVSLTSFPERMYEIKYSLFSLRKQTLKPDEIVLWLAETQFPGREKDLSPSILNLLNKWGIQLKWCEDYGSYKKIIPALNQYPEDIIVTADDDIYYPENWLEILYREYAKYGGIISHRSHTIAISRNRIKKFSKWINDISTGSCSYRNLMTTGSGVLFPPHSLYKDATDFEKIKRLCPKADDIWLWAMAVLQGFKIRVPDDCINILTFVNIDRELRLNGEYSLSIDGVEHRMNDSYISKLIEEYPLILERLA